MLGNIEFSHTRTISADSFNNSKLNNLTFWGATRKKHRINVLGKQVGILKSIIFVILGTKQRTINPYQWLKYGRRDFKF